MTNQEHHAPEEETGEALDRRNFIKGLFMTISGFLTLCMTWPFLSYLMPPSSGGENAFVKVPNFKDLKINAPTKMNFEFIDEQAFMKLKVVHELWVVKHSDTEASVYSPLCPHLNCHYAWNQDKTSFMCPCHNSIFNTDGKVMGGPAPRPLDTLPYKVQGGDLFVQWKLYKPAIEAKIEA